MYTLIGRMQPASVTIWTDLVCFVLFIHM